MLKSWKRNVQGSGPKTNNLSVSPAQSKVSSLFPDLPDALEKQLESLLRPLTLSQGEILFVQGASIEAMYFVTQGILRLNNGTIFKEGDWVTDVSVNPEEFHSCTAQADEYSVLLSISLDRFSTLPDTLRSYLAEGLCQRLRSTMLQSSSDKKYLLSENQALKDALYEASTDKMDSFVKSETAQQVLSKVPRLPVSSVTLLSRLLDEHSTQTEVVDLIKQDASLTSILLKTINSSAYGFQTKISDINHAISLLGFDSVYQIVMSESMRQSLPDTEFFKSMHNASLEVSHLAFCLSQLAGVGKPAEFATVGLMSRIGEVVVELLKTQSPRLSSLFGQVDASAMGAALLKSWGLPEVVYQPVAYKNYPYFAEPSRLPEYLQKAVAVLYLANESREMLHGSPKTRPNIFINQYMTLLGYEQQNLDDVMKKQLRPALMRRRLGLPQSLRKLIE